MSRKVIWMGVYTFITTSFFILYSVQAAEKTDTAYDALVIAKVGDREVKYAALNRLIQMMPSLYKKKYNSDSDFRKKLLEDIIKMILCSEEAKRLKIDQKPNVKEKIEEFVDGILTLALTEEAAYKKSKKKLLRELKNRTPVVIYNNKLGSSNQFDVVAKVGAKKITQEHLNRMIKIMPSSNQNAFSSNNDQLKKLLDRRITTILFSQEAKRLKIDQKPNVKEKIEEIVDSTLSVALAEEAVYKNITVTDKEIENYYKENRDECKMPGKVGVRHILIKVDPNASEQLKKEKKAKAEAILAEAKAGEDFFKLARKYSEDPITVSHGGYVPFFTRGSKDFEFEEAAFKLKKDEISDLILTKKGYHIIKLLEKKEEPTKTLKEATDCIRDKIKRKKRTDGFEELTKKIKAKTPVIIYEDTLKIIINESKKK